MIRLGLSGDCQSISDSQDTLARGSTLCMADDPWLSGSCQSITPFYTDPVWLD